MVSKALARIAVRSLDICDRLKDPSVKNDDLIEQLIRNQCRMLDLADKMEQFVKSNIGADPKDDIPRPHRYRRPPGSRGDSLAQSDSEGSCMMQNSASEPIRSIE